MSERERTVPVTFLVQDGYGGGGVARTVANVANHLAKTHEVRVISFYQHRRKPRFPLDPSISITVVRDRRPAGSKTSKHDPAQEGRVATALAARPSSLRPTPSVRTMSLLTDLLLRRALWDVRSGVLISTRPSLHLAASAFARRSVTTIGWDHLNFPQRHQHAGQFGVLRAAIPGLDGWVVLTQQDAEDYRRALPGIDTEVAVIHNSFTWAVADRPAALDTKVIVAAGRLGGRKNFERLIRAFAPVARRHPDWVLRIYGKGPRRRRLRERAAACGISQQVRLPGYTDKLSMLLATSSVYALSSRAEGFPMVLVEAMSVGLPLVAFDCPRGPADIIDDGSNGFLVPNQDRKAMSKALRRLVEDDALRTRMGAQALEDAHRYTIDAIAADWERLFALLVAKRQSAPARPLDGRR